MKNKRKKVKICWLLIVFLTGAVLGGFAALGAGRVASERGQGASKKGQEIGGGALEEDGSSVAAMGKDAREWDKDSVYTGGDLALYQGKYYRAKWWTLNEIPGQADVWEDAGEAPEMSDGAGALLLPEPGSKGKDEGARVVAYYPSWTSGGFYKDTAISEKVQFDKVTHLVYAFAIPTAEGGLLPLENSGAAKELIDAAHKNGVKVLLAIGGWSYQDVPLEPVFCAATETKDKRERFAESIYSMCREYGFDGIDLDWEHPRVDGESGKQYEELVKLLAERLHREGLLLSLAVLSGATPDGNIYYDAAAHSDQALALADWINIMAYDGGDGERHSTYEFAVSCGRYWSNTRNIPKDKLNLGLPFYSRPGWISYGELLKQEPAASGQDKIMYNGMEVWYNGIETICAKTRYAAENLGGVMIWEITQDTADREKSLLSAIAHVLSEDINRR